MVTLRVMDRSVQCSRLTPLLWITVIVVAVFLSDSVLAQRSDGDPCETHDGIRGVCHPVSKCPSALELIKAHEVPEICSFRGDVAIVCCTPSSSPSALPQPPKPQQPPPPRPAHPRPPPRPVPPLGEEEEGPDEDAAALEGPWWTHPSNSRPSGSRPASTPDLKSGRIAREKCREFSARVTQTISALPLVPNPRPVEVRVPSCDINGLPLIVGGESAQPGEFPHMAAVGFSDGGGGVAWSCGGSLISEEWVLTAAHCTATPLGPPKRVRLGALRIRGPDADSGFEAPVIEVVTHPEYRPPAKYNDIALLRLGTRPHFSKTLRPACLFSLPQLPVNVHKAIATGWGRIDYAEALSDELLKVALDLIDNEACNALWRSASGTKALADGILPSMMCAGRLEGGKDTCQGDSGGPIQITNQENKCVFYVVGVTSFGKVCAAKNAPGVYTRVSAFVPWIESVVWPEGI